MPATNAAMKPGAVQPDGDPVGEGGAGRRDHLRPGVLDEVPPAGMDHDHADEQAGRDPAQTP